MTTLSSSAAVGECRGRPRAVICELHPNGERGDTMRCRPAGSEWLAGRGPAAGADQFAAIWRVGMCYIKSFFVI